MSIKVDIVIPVLNEEKALPVCISNLIAFLSEQSPYSYRIVIADNGSVDSTPEIAQALSEQYPVVLDGKYAGVIGVGGLLLARIPEELAQSRVDYQRKQTEGQDEAVENDLLKDQDKRMPMKFERSSKNFGGTKK